MAHNIITGLLTIGLVLATLGLIYSIWETLKLILGTDVDKQKPRR